MREQYGEEAPSRKFSHALVDLLEDRKLSVPQDSVSGKRQIIGNEPLAVNSPERLAAVKNRKARRFRLRGATISSKGWRGSQYRVIQKERLIRIAPFEIRSSALSEVNLAGNDGQDRLKDELTLY